MEQLKRKSTYQRAEVACTVWTEAELQRLAQARAEHGADWRLIAALYFPQRSPNQVKCKANYLARNDKDGSGRRGLSAFVAAASPREESAQSTAFASEVDEPLPFFGSFALWEDWE